MYFGYLLLVLQVTISSSSAVLSAASTRSSPLQVFLIGECIEKYEDYLKKLIRVQTRQWKVSFLVRFALLR